jgi:hypothetical protein
MDKDLSIRQYDARALSQVLTSHFIFRCGLFWKEDQSG